MPTAPGTYSCLSRKDKHENISPVDHRSVDVSLRRARRSSRKPAGHPQPPADPSSDPSALFQAATEAVLEVQSVQYDYTLEGMSVMEDTVEFFSQGSVFLAKGTDMNDASIHVDYTMTVLPEDTTITGTVVSHGGTAAHLSASQELYVFGEAEDGGAAIVLRDGLPQGAVVREFLFTGEPFGAELNARDTGSTIRRRSTEFPVM